MISPEEVRKFFDTGNDIVSEGMPIDVLRAR